MNTRGQEHRQTQTHIDTRPRTLTPTQIQTHVDVHTDAAEMQT